MCLKLNNLEITGLKCYESSGVIPFHDLTVFIGENDAGKSTVYDALDYVLNNKQPLVEEYREGCDTIKIICNFEVLEEHEDLQQFIVSNKFILQKTFNKNGSVEIEVLGEVFLDDDLNIFETMNAPDLRALLERLQLEAQPNQDLRKESVREYIGSNDLDREQSYREVRWNQISQYLPIFQRYTSSEYGNPTATIRKTLELVYREFFYTKDEEGNEVLKTDFSNYKQTLETSLNTKLETQLLSHIQKYKPDITSINGNYDIDFARGLSFNGLSINTGNGNVKTLDQMGDGTKKKIFLSILEWDSEISMETETTRTIIRAYDEPDAHLHFHAQREMFYIIKDLAEDADSNIQSIICTHALTMIDRAPANCINHVINDNGNSKINYLVSDTDEDIEKFLSQVSEIGGLKNSSVFYEKCFLLVEGEGEENALPIMYKTYTGKSMIEDGIVLINLQTNGQWSNALKFLKVNKKNATVLLLDTDTQYPDSNSRVSKEKLEEIGFDETFLNENCFFIGTKEFEDVFSDLKYTELCNHNFRKDDTTDWSETDFSVLRAEDKFSESLKKMLSRTCRTRIGKPEISLKMAESLSLLEIQAIDSIKNLFDRIQNIIS